MPVIGVIFVLIVLLGYFIAGFSTNKPPELSNIIPTIDAFKEVKWQITDVKLSENSTISGCVLITYHSPSNNSTNTRSIMDTSRGMGASAPDHRICLDDGFEWWQPETELFNPKTTITSPANIYSREDLAKWKLEHATN